MSAIFFLRHFRSSVSIIPILYPPQVSLLDLKHKSRLAYKMKQLARVGPPVEDPSSSSSDEDGVMLGIHDESEPDSSDSSSDPDISYDDLSLDDESSDSLSESSISHGELSL